MSELTLKQVQDWIRSQQDADVLSQLNRDVLIPKLKALRSDTNYDVLSSVRPGDVVFCKWSDGYIYPLIVQPWRGARSKNLLANYVYESGATEGWNVPASRTQLIVASADLSHEDPHFIAKLMALAEEAGVDAVSPEHGQFFINTIVAAKKGF